jgi:hypothetical protein
VVHFYRNVFSHVPAAGDDGPQVNSFKQTIINNCVQLRGCATAAPF